MGTRRPSRWTNPGSDCTGGRVRRLISRPGLPGARRRAGHGTDHPVDRPFGRGVAAVDGHAPYRLMGPGPRATRLGGPSGLVRPHGAVPWRCRAALTKLRRHWPEVGRPVCLRRLPRRGAVRRTSANQIPGGPSGRTQKGTRRACGTGGARRPTRPRPVQRAPRGGPRRRAGPSPSRPSTAARMTTMPSGAAATAAPTWPLSRVPNRGGGAAEGTGHAGGGPQRAGWAPAFG